MKRIKHILYKSVIAIFLVVGYSNVYSQHVQFRLANFDKTKDASGHYYEADVIIKMKQCSNCDKSGFKLGSGQLYLNYNPEAFGENISKNQRISVEVDENSILSERLPFFDSFINVYTYPNNEDNTSSRVSIFFDQSLSAGSILENNVTSGSKKLFRIKLKYVDKKKKPNLTFQGTHPYDDQFYNACGPFTSGFNFANCSSYPGERIVNDSFFKCNNCQRSTKPLIKEIVAKKMKLYPNPSSSEFQITGANDSFVEIRDMSGNLIQPFLNYNGEIIKISGLKKGIYFVSIVSNKTGDSSKLKLLVK